MNIKRYLLLGLVAAGIGAATLGALPASAKTNMGWHLGTQKHTLDFQGNGQPVVAGKVTAVSGSTITLTNAGNTTYTINTANAKFLVKGATNATIANILVGDTIVVQGTVNGTLVDASSVIGHNKKHLKFGGFLKHFFGF